MNSQTDTSHQLPLPRCPPADPFRTGKLRSIEELRPLGSVRYDNIHVRDGCWVALIGGEPIPLGRLEDFHFIPLPLLQASRLARFAIPVDQIGSISEGSVIVDAFIPRFEAYIEPGGLLVPAHLASRDERGSEGTLFGVSTIDPAGRRAYWTGRYRGTPNGVRITAP